MSQAHLWDPLVGTAGHQMAAMTAVFIWNLQMRHLNSEETLREQDVTLKNPD